MNAANNVNDVGRCGREEVYTLKHKDLQEIQDAFARKAVTELNSFENVYFEICNEPYFGGITLEWQGHIAQVIADTEKGLPNKHLIAQNIANGRQKIEKPNPLVSIFNFHYAEPPDTVGMNFGLNRAISDDETGFRGSADVLYRTEAWDFILAGGGGVQQSGLFLHAEPPGGDAPGLQVARRRQRGTEGTAANPQGVHGELRVRSDETAKRLGEGRQYHRRSWRQGR